MDKFLPLLIANFVVLQNKMHVIHTNAKWPEFLYFHPFMDTVYSFFGDGNIDALRERAMQLHIDLPNTLSEYLTMSKVKDITVVPSISACVSIVLNDLSFMCNMLQLGVIESWKANDVVTQNLLSDLQDTCGVFKWKLDIIK